MGGLLASAYLRTVFLWMPNSLAIARMERPRSLACCTAFHRTLCRGVSFLHGDAGGLRTLPPPFNVALSPLMASEPAETTDQTRGSICLPGSGTPATSSRWIRSGGLCWTASGRAGWAPPCDPPATLLTHKPHRTHTRCQLLLTTVLARYSGCHGVTCLLHINRCVVHSCSATWPNISPPLTLLYSPYCTAAYIK